VQDSEIANEKSENVVRAPGEKGLQINGGGDGDAVSFRARRGFRLSLFRGKFSERLGGGCEKNVVHGRSMFLCERTDVVDGAIRKTPREETGAEVEWVAQMDSASATMPEIVSNTGDQGTKPKSRVFQSVIVIACDPQRRQILGVTVIVSKDAPHESAE